jgi:uncharacterized protein
MDITPLLRPEQKMIQSYAAGYFRVNGVVYRHPILIGPETVIEWSGENDAFQSLKGETDILLIGMGINAPILPPSKRAAFLDLGFVVEMMDTPSACRTFNVLNSESRRVTAALIPV